MRFDIFMVVDLGPPSSTWIPPWGEHGASLHTGMILLPLCLLLLPRSHYIWLVYIASRIHFDSFVAKTLGVCHNCAVDEATMEEVSWKAMEGTEQGEA
jgi:hypothetical protein